MSETVFDPGLQPERTLLAWRRTCLAFGVANVVALRFTVEAGGVAAAFVALAGTGLAAIAYVAAAVGYRRAHASLHRDETLDRDARPMAAATAAALVFGLATAGYVAFGAMRALGG